MIFATQRGYGEWMLMNYIFLKHYYPMIVIRSKGKKLYLDALGKADKMVGPIPSDGAQASLEEARDFVAYINQQMEKTLICNGMEKRGVAHGKFYWFPQPKTVG